MSDPRAQAHPDELLQELLDGRLDAVGAAAVEEHLAGCERCRRLRDTLLATRRLLRETAAAEPPPPDLRARVEDVVARQGEPRRGAHTGWLALAAALLLLAVGAAFWLRAPEVVADPIDELARLHAGAEPTIPLTDPAALERELERRVGFDPRVLDLAMMQLELTGGGTATIDGRPTAFMVYQGPAGRLVCAMLRGRLEELPAPDEVRSNENFTFRVYQRGELTVVAWQEGDLVCFLIGPGGRESVVGLAMAKAMLRV